MSMRFLCAVPTFVFVAWISTYGVTCPAAEAIRPAGPIGGTDIQQALLPPPGVYAAAVVVPINFFSFSTSRGATPASGHSLDAGVAVLWVYDLHLFGGSIASSVSLAYGHSCFQLEQQPRFCSKAGLDDSYADVFVWSRFFPSKEFDSARNQVSRIPFGLAVQAGLGIMFPTGTYDPNRVVNNSANFYDFAPNIALTYNVRSLFGERLGDATEFSMRIWFNNYTQNHSTHYQTGRLLNVDFAITQRMGHWQFGFTGTAFKQIEDDKIAGINVPDGGARSDGVAIGPLISYSFVAHARPWIITLKGLYAVSATNTAWPRGVVLRVATRF